MAVKVFRPMLTTLFSVIWQVGFAAPTVTPTPPRPHATPWFLSIDQNAKLLDETQCRRITRFIHDRINHTLSSDAPFPITETQDATPRTVFLSISDLKTPAITVRGSGIGLRQAVLSALDQAQNRLPSSKTPRVVKVDFVDSVRKIAPLPLDHINPDTKGLFGVIPKDPSEHAMIPADVLSKPATVNPHSDITYLFNVFSFYDDGQHLEKLFRGHRLANTLSPSVIEEHLQYATNYLKQSVHPDGQFDYLYNADQNGFENDYNILRHAGTTYAMLQLYQHHKDQELLNDAKCALDYLAKSIMPCGNPSTHSQCLIENGSIKIGGNGLAILAFAKYAEVTKESKYNMLMTQLGNWILSMQEPTGEFKIQTISYPFEQPMQQTCDFYPGEALLALNRLNQIVPDKKWLDAAEKGAQFLITVRDKNKTLDELQPDHWLLYTLNELYRARKNPMYLEHAFKIADAMIAKQIRKPHYPDWYGGYYTPPRSTPTATRTEALCSAFLLARDFSDTERRKTLLNAIHYNVHFQLQTQLMPELAMHYPNPHRALGGFRSALTTNDVRIDYVQHNVSGILTYFDIITR